MTFTVAGAERVRHRDVELPPPAKQSNDFNGSGNDYELKQSSGLTSLITAGCHLEWIHEPASAKQSQTITDTAFSPTGHNVAVEVQGASGDADRPGHRHRSRSRLPGRSIRAGTVVASPRSPASRRRSRTAGRRSSDLKSAYTGTGFTARASALGLQTAASDSAVRGPAKRDGLREAMNPCLLSCSAHERPGRRGRARSEPSPSLPSAIRSSMSPITNGGCANFMGGTGFAESDSRNGDGSLDFTISIPTSYLKKTYGPNFGQPNVPICVGVKRLNSSFQPIDCNPKT